MLNKNFSLQVAVLLTFFAFLPLIASAQSAHTYVSGTGMDTGSCTAVAPCRSFGYAISQTIANGVVEVKASGDFDPFTINNKSVSIVAPEGIHARILVSNGVDSAVTVNALGNNVVSLQGLVLQGVGGGYGVSFVSGRYLDVRKCDISSFYVGLRLTQGKVSVSDTVCHENNYGMTLVQDALNTTAIAHIVRSRFDNNSTGMLAGNASSTLTLVLQDTAFVKNTLCGVELYTGNGKRLDISVENSLISDNGVGIKSNDALAQARVSNSTITNNTTGIVGNVISRGNNSVEENGNGNSFSSTYLAK